MSIEEFRTIEVRESSEVAFNCHAVDSMFGDYDKMPKKMQNWFNDDNNSIPCDGGGKPGPWCQECVFGSWYQRES